jgi:hypothetical protein
MDGMYCSYPCYALSDTGIAKVNARHVLKAAQKEAREAVWAAADKEGVLVSAQNELEGYSGDDDGEDW